MYIRQVPKLIDHDRRATAITEAAWRVLVRGGVRAVSVRNVAAEATVATASLRRLFPTQASLLASCLTLVRERVSARIQALPQPSDAIEGAIAVIAETLPLDEERSLEMEVYLTLGMAALTDQELRAAYKLLSNDLVALCAAIIDQLVPHRSPSLRQREAAHLFALIDGLALHTLHGDDPAQARDVLRSYLTHIARSETVGGL